MQKRLEISEETIENLRLISVDLDFKPKSIEALEKAIAEAASMVAELKRYGCRLEEGSEKRIEGLVAYDLAESREAFINQAVNEKIATLLPALKEKIEEETRAKQESFGITEEKA